MRLVALVGAIAALLLGLSSAFDLPGGLLIAAAVVAFAGTIVGLIRERRHDADLETTRAELAKTQTELVEARSDLEYVIATPETVRDLDRVLRAHTASQRR